MTTYIQALCLAFGVTSISGYYKMENFPCFLEVFHLYSYTQKSIECGFISDILVLNTISEIPKSVIIL